MVMPADKLKKKVVKPLDQNKSFKPQKKQRQEDNRLKKIV